MKFRLSSFSCGRSVLQDAAACLRLPPRPLPCWKHEGLFPDTHCESRLSKSHKVGAPPYDRVSLEFLNLRSVHRSLQPVFRFSTGFSSPSLTPTKADGPLSANFL